MKTRHIILIVIFLILIFSVLSCPFLFRGINFQEKNLEDDKALIISDLHLESNPRNLSCIGNYLEENKISLLVLNGDIFDRKPREEFQKEFLDVIEKRLGIKEDFPSDIIYDLSFYNHDPYLKNDGSQYFQENGKEISVFQGVLDLKVNEEPFYILHGDYVFSDTIGILALINKFTSTLLWERASRSAIGVGDNYWVILGHSHVPGIDYQRKIANSGFWINRYFSATDTGVLIEANEKEEPKVELIKIPCD